jgi:hypothetical protein
MPSALTSLMWVVRMPKCGHCEGHVLPDTVRCLYPEDVDPTDLPGCPACTVIRGAEWTRKRNGRDDAERQDSGQGHVAGGGPDDKTLYPLEGGEP